MVQVKQGPWKQVEESIPVIESTGDSYNKLREARDKYYKKANKVVLRHTTEDGIEAVFVEYANQLRIFGDRVSGLIPQEIENNATVIDSESTRTTSEEGITSGGDSASKELEPS